jgi:hypothetical protein
VAQFDAGMMGVVATFVHSGVLEMLTTRWWVFVETVVSSLKERTSDIDSDHCCSREYAVHCLRTYGASKTRLPSTRETARLYINMTTKY